MENETNTTLKNKPAGNMGFLCTSVGVEESQYNNSVIKIFLKKIG